MYRLTRSAGFVTLALCLGCAARPVTPVAMSQPGDDALTCAQLDQQITDNQKSAAVMVEKDKQVERDNTAKVAASVIFSAWLAGSIDLTHEEQILMRSLYDRNERLNGLERQKGCPTA